ncbi:hypothetical protein ACS0TY_001927 [Phlomoides rotata]
MARAKIASLCILTLLLFLAVSDHVVAGRGPTFSAPVKKLDLVDEDECGGEEDECMMRRTLEAHLDYIYTQKQKQP